jgi:hypothetical protein
MEHLSSDVLTTICQYLASCEDKLIFWFVCTSNGVSRAKIHQALANTDSIANIPAKIYIPNQKLNFYQYIDTIIGQTASDFWTKYNVTKISKIILEGLATPNEIIKTFKKFPNLTELHISNSKDIDFTHLTSLASLRTLNIHEVHTVNATSNFMFGLTNLSSLSFNVANDMYMSTKWKWDLTDLVSLTNLTFKIPPVCKMHLIINLTNIAFLSLSSNVIMDNSGHNEVAIAEIVHNSSVQFVEELKQGIDLLGRSPVLNNFMVDYGFRTLFEAPGPNILDLNFMSSLRYVKKLSIIGLDSRKVNFNFDLVLDEFTLKNSFFTANCTIGLNKLISCLTKLTLENNVIITSHGATGYFCPNFVDHKLKFLTTDLQSQSWLNSDTIKRIVQIENLRLTNTNFLKKVVVRGSKRIYQTPFINSDTFIKNFCVEHNIAIKTAVRVNNFNNLCKRLQLAEKILCSDTFGNKVCDKIDQPFEFGLSEDVRIELDTYAKTVSQMDSDYYLIVQYLYEN